MDRTEAEIPPCKNPLTCKAEILAERASWGPGKFVLQSENSVPPDPEAHPSTYTTQALQIPHHGCLFLALALSP